MEPTSEQELKQLLDEGRITEDEYKELLEAIRQKEMTLQKPPEKPNEPKPRTGYGKAALILMIIGFLLPLVPLIINIIMSMQATSGSTPRMVMLSGCPFLFLGFLCLLLAFIFGILGWKTSQGKIAAIGVPCLGLLIVPGILLLGLFGFRPVKIPVGSTANPRTVIQSYPIHSMAMVLTQDGVEFDRTVSSDGNGSLKIQNDLPEKQTFRLFASGPINADYCMLIYSAKLQTDSLDGNAYLEMLCSFEGKGEFFSRSIEQSVAGTTQWTTIQTPFRLEAGQMPDDVRLNLVIEGSGTVWIDDIELLSSPLD
jgi:hypothetical protein